MSSASSPYIVTTKRRRRTPASEPPDYSILSRRAVATLDHELPRLMREHGASNEQVAAAMAVVEPGRPVGPLPDGTVIEPEATTWRALAYVDSLPLVEAADYTARRAEQGDPEAQQRILDAYNARQ